MTISKQQHKNRIFVSNFGGYLYLLRKLYLGDLLERVCNKTEFEVEGWRKIPPLMKILEQQYIPTGVIEKMKLEMIQIPPIFKKEQIDEAIIDKNPRTWRAKLGEQRLIRDSWIYDHFTNDSTKKTKIALYVNSVIPINQNLEPSEKNEMHDIEKIVNHCVVALGLKVKNGKECLELEIYGGCDDTRFIPVDFPFFEEIQIEVKKINAKHHNQNQGVGDYYNRAMNKLGRHWAEKKWGTMEKKWWNKLNECQWKYEMLFVQGIHPCFKLKFTS